MNILNSTLSFLRSEEGATATEYAVMLALIIAVAIATIIILGIKVESLFNDFDARFGKAVSTGGGGS